jgi:hypothetical protein
MNSRHHDPRDPPIVSPTVEQPTPEQWERLVAMDAILALVQRHGASTVMGWVIDNANGPDGLYGLIDKYGRDRAIRWVRLAAHIAGQDVV